MNGNDSIANDVREIKDRLATFLPTPLGGIFGHAASISELHNTMKEMLQMLTVIATNLQQTGGAKGKPMVAHYAPVARENASLRRAEELSSQTAREVRGLKAAIESFIGKFSKGRQISKTQNAGDGSGVSESQDHSTPYGTHWPGGYT